MDSIKKKHEGKLGEISMRPICDRKVRFSNGSRSPMGVRRHPAIDEFTPKLRPSLDSLVRLAIVAVIDNTVELGIAGCIVSWRTHYIAPGILWEIVYGRQYSPKPRSTVKCSPIRITGTLEHPLPLLPSPPTDLPRWLAAGVY